MISRRNLSEQFCQSLIEGSKSNVLLRTTKGGFITRDKIEEGIKKGGFKLSVSALVAGFDITYDQLTKVVDDSVDEKVGGFRVDGDCLVNEKERIECFLEELEKKIAKDGVCNLQEIAEREEYCGLGKDQLKEKSSWKVVGSKVYSEDFIRKEKNKILKTLEGKVQPFNVAKIDRYILSLLVEENKLQGKVDKNMYIPDKYFDWIKNTVDELVREQSSIQFGQMKSLFQMEEDEARAYLEKNFAELVQLSSQAITADILSKFVAALSDNKKVFDGIGIIDCTGKDLDIVLKSCSSLDQKKQIRLGTYFVSNQYWKHYTGQYKPLIRKKLNESKNINVINVHVQNEEAHPKISPSEIKKLIKEYFGDELDLKRATIMSEIIDQTQQYLESLIPRVFQKYQEELKSTHESGKRKLETLITEKFNAIQIHAKALQVFSANKKLHAELDKALMKGRAVNDISKAIIMLMGYVHGINVDDPIPDRTITQIRSRMKKEEVEYFEKIVSPQQTTSHDYVDVILKAATTLGYHVRSLDRKKEQFFVKAKQKQIETVINTLVDPRQILLHMVIYYFILKESVYVLIPDVATLKKILDSVQFENSALSSYLNSALGYVEKLSKESQPPAELGNVLRELYEIIFVHKAINAAPVIKEETQPKKPKTKKKSRRL